MPWLLFAMHIIFQFPFQYSWGMGMTHGHIDFPSSFFIAHWLDAQLKMNITFQFAGKNTERIESPLILAVCILNEPKSPVNTRSLVLLTCIPRLVMSHTPFCPYNKQFTESLLNPLCVCRHRSCVKIMIKKLTGLMMIAWNRVMFFSATERKILKKLVWRCRCRQGRTWMPAYLISKEQYLLDRCKKFSCILLESNPSSLSITFLCSNLFSFVWMTQVWEKIRLSLI